jgi:hypothetical protein
LALAAVRFAALATLRALPRAVAAFRFGAFDCFLRLAMIAPVGWCSGNALTLDHQVPATYQTSYQQIAA